MSRLERDLSVFRPKALSTASALLADKSQGVLSIKLLEKRFALDMPDLDKASLRSLATDISGMLKNQRELASLGLTYGQEVKKGADGQSEFFYRSDHFKGDTAEQKAADRHRELIEQLDAQLEAKRLEKEEKLRERETAQRARRESAAAKETVPTPYTIHLVVQEEYDGRKAPQEQKGSQEVVLSEFSAGLGNMNAILSLDILSRFVKRGLTKTEIDTMIIPLMRDAIVVGADAIEARAREVAENILTASEQKSKKGKPGMRVTVPLPVTYIGPVNAALMQVATEQGNDHVTFETGDSHMPNTPYTAEVLDRWSNRYTPAFLEQFSDAIAATGTPAAKALLTILHEDPDTLLKVPQAREVMVGDFKLTKQTIDSMLSPLILNNEILLRGLLQDVLGVVYPVSYYLVFDEQKYSYFALMCLGILTDQFKAAEMYNLLAPSEPDKYKAERSAVQARYNVASATLEGLKKLRGKKPSREQVEAAQRAFDTVREERAGVLALETEAKKGVAAKLTDHLSARIPRTDPKTRDYEGGRPAAYVEALQRFRKIVEIDPEYPEPQLEDYQGGERSRAYRIEDDAYEAWTYLQPEAWPALRQRMREKVPAFKVHAVMMPEHAEGTRRLTTRLNL
ncbi:MAG: hypothetical protein KGJ07_04220 [Patescibacteria group bacterium]|nr:hypothetical protein [Patescibacteria group bacterium]